MSARVIGIGGIFFKARDPERLRAWYREHLGLAIGDWGGVQFEGRTSSPAGRVEDLDTVLDALRREGCEVDERTESSEYGRFGWVADPEGNRLELWEPPKP
jgi:catechol 2,3-dioxygenase-like lactoylglutathione lyase family enzyme